MHKCFYRLWLCLFAACHRTHLNSFSAAFHCPGLPTAAIVAAETVLPAKIGTAEATGYLRVHPQLNLMVTLNKLTAIPAQDGQK